MKYSVIAAGCFAGLIISLIAVLPHTAGDRQSAAPAPMSASVLVDNDADDNVWLIPRIVLDGARSFADWLMLPDQPVSPTDRENRGRLKDFDGLFSPQMQQHWDAFATHPDKHYLKNIGSEWVRLDPQRAYKTLSFCLVVGSLLVMLISLAAGIGIGLALHRRRDRAMPGRPMPRTGQLKPQ